LTLKMLYVSMVAMKDTGTMEFHVSRRARDRYSFDEAIFSSAGNVVFANFHAARVFAQKMNRKRDLKKHPEEAVKPGHIAAMGLIDETLHYMVWLYRRDVNGNAMKDALDSLYVSLGREEVDKALRTFTDEFPPVAVYRGETSTDAYLEGATGDTPNRLIALEEMLLLWLANMNPAFAPFMELFDETLLRKTTVYPHIISGLRTYFDGQGTFGPGGLHLIDILRSPAVNVPHSLSGQLEYLRTHWGVLLKTFIRRILKGIDLIKEEEKQTFQGPGPAKAYSYKDRDTGLAMELEAERFSPDLEWMPRLVLMAKNIYVWLHQLSGIYGYPITKLDHIPDEELDTLRQSGFSGLWLIGVWERSPSSQKIKQLCGNPEAVPSAYSLFDYQIAADLGGEEAYENLRDRAWARGIRLASDMVPNHVGIYSRWTIEHPDWFVSLDYNPFPWYTFNGPDLSLDERVSIFLEDHYYNRTDAAVVFKRVDRWTGSEKYVYHGNDGTSMPWNDTAQLNYLNPEAREAMIQTILHVARKFPVIRFDAAMTLTKKHYQRLWFPEPGTGGDISTRGEFGLTREEFNALMPQEFWREVVDRVAAEAPDTLLLAEAFWLLEGYFVRTLGMHRVYNSAFMNMLRDEENAEYRQVMKNTLEFEPEVLRRFVNFMNNPDERTAVDQFGKDSKYFGVCVLMITMPGLPMFGHGQIEGFEERYGMEYRRAYYQESPDGYLADRHQREIFPLLHRRHLFSGVDRFFLYDFFTAQGSVNEDVFVYSNQSGDERTLVAYNNRNADASGWIRTSVAYSVKAGHGDGRALSRKTLGEGLSVNDGEGHFTVFRDHASGLHFIRKGSEIHREGLYLQLDPYGYHVFLDFQEVADDEWGHYARLSAFLNGRGVPDIRTAMEEMLLRPVHDAFREVVNVATFRRLRELSEYVPGPEKSEQVAQLLAEVEEKTLRLIREMKRHAGYGLGDEITAAYGIRRDLESLLHLSSRVEQLGLPYAGPPGGGGSQMGDASPGPDLEEDMDLFLRKKAIQYICRASGSDPFFFYALSGWVFLRNLGKEVAEGADTAVLNRALIDKWSLGPIVATVLEGLGMENAAAAKSIKVIKLLTGHDNLFGSGNDGKIPDTMELIFSDRDSVPLLGINEYERVLWFSKEGFFELLIWFLTVDVIAQSVDKPDTPDRLDPTFDHNLRLLSKLCMISERSHYQVPRFLAIVKSEMGQSTKSPV
jgi:glycosidase